MKKQQHYILFYFILIYLQTVYNLNNMLSLSVVFSFVDMLFHNEYT